MPGLPSRQQQAPKSAPRQQRQLRRQRWERQCERAHCRWLRSPRSISDNEAGGRGEHVGANLFVRSRFVSLPLLLSLSTALSIISYWKQKWSTLRCVERESERERWASSHLSLSWVSGVAIVVVAALHLLGVLCSVCSLPARALHQAICV